jgi:putative transposase
MVSGHDARHRRPTGLIHQALQTSQVLSFRETLCPVILFISGLSLRDVSEKFCLTFASRESVRIWAYRSSSLFKPSRRVRRLVAVDETVLKVNGQTCYLWAAIDVDTNEILALYASRGRGIPNAIKFLKMFLRSCDGKPIVVVDRGPWYRWALERRDWE